MSAIEPHLHAARLAVALGRRDEAIHRYEQALRIDPAIDHVRFELANALFSAERFVEASRHFALVSERDPHASGALGNLAKCLLRIGRADDSVAAGKRAFAASGDREHWSVVLLASNAASGVTEEQVVRDHLAYASMTPIPVDWNPPTRPPGPPSAIRVGFVSSDLRRHPVAKFLEPVLPRLAEAGLECHAFSNNAFEDEVTGRLRGLFRSWTSIGAIDDFRALALLRAARMDALVDLSGHTVGHRLPLFAMRAAPVQITWLGYPNTTGVAAMDWRIVDEVTDPPGAERLSSEQLLRIRSPFLCFAGRSVPSPRERSPGPPAFISLNNPAKLSDHTIRLWSRVLVAVPSSRLILRLIGVHDPSLAADLRSRFGSCGVAGDRIDFDDWKSSGEDHLDVHRRADVALDPFPYHGTTTTCEAIACGVPVVTRIGGAHRSRVGATLLSAVDLPDLIAADDDDFVRIASTLMQTPERLRELRSVLPGRARHGRLGDVVGFSEALASAIRRAVGVGGRDQGPILDRERRALDDDRAASC